MIKISVVIPTLNEEAYIGALLESIQSQTLAPHEVLVVDCGSEDKTQQVVKTFSNVRLLKTHKPVGHQRSYGGKKATGDIILFLDADVILSETFIQKSVDEWEKRKLDIACPKYIPYPGSLGIRAFYAFFNWLFDKAQKHKPSGAGSGIFVTKKLFKEVGGFDATLTFDDIEFIRKAGEHGKFGILNTFIHVSDRRIRKEGLFKVTAQYMILSYYFARGNYDAANNISYEFGVFKKNS